MTPSQLAVALGHSFARKNLLQVALTHRSYGALHNERLEFLGDSVLNCVVANSLYSRYPELPEGDLSRLRANLVCQESLHQLALSLKIGEVLLLGEGELKSGGHQRPSILADALEALFGAVFLDAGFDAAALTINRLYEPLYEKLRPGEVIKDPKTRLQEWLQGRKKPLPRYQLLEATGAAHDQRFSVVCEIDNPSLRTTGTGMSRRTAEQAAADNALKALKA
ncbi:MAG: ribonuclease III [Rhodocyclaceae bacterium]|nr:ribonuclease III [Rhodocyclaceae bacterium]